MDEGDFLSRYPMRPWTRSDFENGHRESIALAHALWLRNTFWGDAETMSRQLLAASPEIPAGMGLPDLRVLERLARLGLRYSNRAPKAFAWIGGRSLTIWEARYEIVRRAIDFLEHR
ncbi:MAG TPA: hypothetical protein VGR97_06785 [Candidatus Acidoferrales bacterium]|nr:hypothetical protein [Candidatus Acidoferrales bacterium]